MTATVVMTSAALFKKKSKDKKRSKADKERTKRTSTMSEVSKPFFAVEEEMRAGASFYHLIFLRMVCFKKLWLLVALVWWC